MWTPRPARSVSIGSYLIRDLVQLAMADTELDDLLADGFDLEIVETPIVDADMLVAESEAVKLGLRLTVARRWRL